MNELNSYSTAGYVVQEVFSSIRTVLSLNGIEREQKRYKLGEKHCNLQQKVPVVFRLLSYDKELNLTIPSTIRKGAAIGVFMGWISLTTYLVYAVGFIGELLLSQGKYRSMNIGDILAVCELSGTSVDIWTCTASA